MKIGPLSSRPPVLKNLKTGNSLDKKINNHAFIKEVLDETKSISRQLDALLLKKLSKNYGSDLLDSFQELKHVFQCAGQENIDNNLDAIIPAFSSIANQLGEVRLNLLGDVSETKEAPPLGKTIKPPKLMRSKSDGEDKLEVLDPSMLDILKAVKEFTELIFLWNLATKMSATLTTTATQTIMIQQQKADTANMITR